MLRRLINSIGPGIFILGYIIGTGSVTSMASSGARFGLSLLWALALSCLFTFVMNVAISRVTMLHQKTILQVIRERFGLTATLLIFAGVMLTVIASVMGLMGIVSDVIREVSIPIVGGNGIPPLLSVLVISGLLYYLYAAGNQNFFLQAMAILVGVMSTCSLLTVVFIAPSPATILQGLIPSLPEGNDAPLILAGMVGTTMATVCLVTRSYLVAEKGWSVNDLRAEQRDSAIALTFTFLVSAAIMIAAAGTMHAEGIEVSSAMDMVKTLTPLAGSLATVVFVVGIIAAGISSTFPNYLLGPWAVFDLTGRPREMHHPRVRIAVLAIALLGLVVPIFGGRPVILMIASQAVSPVVMPLLVLFVTLLLTDKRHTDRYQNPRWLTIGLWVTFIFSLFVSYAGIVGLTRFLQSLGSG